MFSDFSLIQVREIILLLSAALTVVYGIKKFFKGPNYTVLSKQLYCFYLPVFRKLQPSLFQGREIAEIKEILSYIEPLIDQYYELIDPNISYHLEQCKTYLQRIESLDFPTTFSTEKRKHEEKVQSEFKSLESLVSKRYDYICNNLGMPVRSMSYKFHYKQLSFIQSFSFTILKILGTVICFEIAMLTVYFIFLKLLDFFNFGKLFIESLI